MHQPELVPMSETHKILWDFEIQTDHLIPTRKPNLVIINKKQKNNSRVDFAVPENHRMKTKENEKRENYLYIARELKTVEHESNGDTICNWLVLNGTQELGKRTGRIEHRRTNEDHPN